MSTPPLLIRNHLDATGGQSPLLIVHEERVYVPEPPLVSVNGAFLDNGKGGFIGAGMAADGGFGYLNERGEWVVAPTLQDARQATADGLGRFCDNGLWGYCDLEGKVVIPPQYEACEAFYHGLAAVNTGTAWRYIDRSGAFAFDQTFFAARAFSDAGLAVASASLSGGYGYIDREGKWAIPPRFRVASGFSTHPAAPVSLDGRRYGLIDTKGQWIMEPAGMLIMDFNADGYVHFSRDKVAGAGYMDTSGREVITEEDRLSRYMQSGLALDGDRIYLGVRGRLATSHYLSWGGPFTTHGFTVARAALDNPPGGGVHQHYSWGILHTDGRFLPAPEDVLEPLTSSDQCIVWPEYGTPLAAFCTRDQNIALLDGEASIAYRLERDSNDGVETVTLRDAAGHLLWRSAPSHNVERATPFFLAPAASFLIGLDACEQLPAIADTLLAQTELRLHALAAGESMPDDDYDDGVDEDEDDDYDDSFPDDPRISRRLFRSYLDEETWGAYMFLSEWRGGLSKQTCLDMIATLTARLGPGTPDPDYGGEEPAPDTLAWQFALNRPLPGSEAQGPESRRLWLGIHTTVECGDGDIWHEVWLHCAPSRATLDAAMAAAPARSETDDDQQHDDDDEDIQEKYPETYDEWLAAVCQFPKALAHAPSDVLDEPMIDAALEANVAAYTHLPDSLQTPDRLAALIRRGATWAADIPCECMTAEGLALARSLYSEEQEWHWADVERSTLPEKPLDLNSLYRVWGCLIDEPLAFEAVQAGVDLDDIPRWLRSDRVVAAK